MKFKYISKLERGFRRHRWQLKSRNGVIVDSSSQSFASKQGAERNARLTRDLLARATL